MDPRELSLIIEEARLKDAKKKIAFAYADAKSRMILTSANIKALLEYFKLTDVLRLEDWEGKELPEAMKKIVNLACLMTDLICDYHKVEFPVKAPSREELELIVPELKKQRLEEELEKINSELAEEAEEEMPIIE